MDAMLMPGLAPSSYSEVSKFINQSKFAKKRFDEASKVIGFSLEESFKLATEMDHEVKETAFMANTMALIDHYKEQIQREPHFVIGPSFGVLAAAVQTQTLSYQDAIWFAYKSAKLSKDYYEELNERYVTHFVYNLSIEDAYYYVDYFQEDEKYIEITGFMDKVLCFTGPTNTIEELKTLLNKKKKCFSLHTMKQPIHSKILTNLRNRIENDLISQLSFEQLSKPYISDVNGEVTKDSNDFIESLLGGYDNPVRWDLVVQQIKANKIERIDIIGPKNLFSQLLKDQVHINDINPDTNLSNKLEI